MSRIVHALTGEIDWPEFHSRIAKAFDASPDALQPTPEQAKEILEERARRLARAGAESEAATETLEILSFTLGRELYGLETRFALEVIRLVEFTAIPGTPDFVIGVTNLRGAIIPVFDLMRFFGFSSQGLIDRSRVIVVGDTVADFGIIADSVHAVSRLAVDEFLPDPAFKSEHGRECVRGVTHQAMIVLDGLALLNDQRLFIDSSH